MSRLSFIFLFLWCAFVNALVWDGPKPTNGPTSLIASAVAPKISALATLFKRATESVGPQTCGYVAADQTRPATCSESSSCVWHTDFKVVGCCDMYKSNSACVFYTSCRDAGSDTTYVDDPLVYTCTGSQICYNNVYNNGYFQVGCGGTQVIVRTTFEGQLADAPTVQVVFTGNRELMAPPATKTETSTVTETPSTTITFTATSIPGTQPGQQGIAGGAVAGIAIGSLAVGAIAAALLTFCLLQHKNRKDAAAMGNYQGPQSGGYVYHERHPSMTTYASPHPQFSAPVSPYMYSAGLAPRDGPMHQVYSHELSGQPSEMEAPLGEMAASPVAKTSPTEVKMTETSNVA